MPRFAYRAATPEGRTVRGVEEAASAGALERLLTGRGLLPLEVTPPRAAEEAGRGRRSSVLVSRRADVTDFFVTFAALLQAGLPLDRALEVAARGAARADVADAIAGVRQRVREGGQVAEGFAAHPELFPPVVVGLIRAAERGGHLAESVRRLADHLERERALKARITSAMVYPLLMLCVGGGALAVLLLFVLPRFVALLQDTGGTLPRSTAFLIAVSTFGTRGWPWIALGGSIVALAYVGWRSSEEGRERTDAIFLRIPVVGALRARHATARLARTLGTLLTGGVPLLSAIEIAQGTVGDAAVAADLQRSREAVRRGEAFSDSLARGRAFPYAFLRLVEVGEETGELDAVLERAAGLLEAELERRLERLVALLEPGMIVVFGGVVGFVALALLQAIYGIHADAL